MRNKADTRAGRQFLKEVAVVVVKEAGIGPEMLG